MKKLNEEDIIRVFQKNLKQKFVAEDVEIFRHKTGCMVSSIDTLVESTDVPQGMDFADIARKSIAACISDFAAKGVRPEFGIISITLPDKFAKKHIVKLSKGFQKASKEFKVKILGGDTNEGRELSISVALFANTDKIIRRAGAKNADLICVTGSFGNAAAGLQLLKEKKGHAGGQARLKRAFCKPMPKLNFGVRIKKYMSSSMDSSDGLAKTLNEMANQSGKKFIIDNLPVENELEVFSSKSGLDLEKMVFFGGEEYEFVFTVSARNFTKIKNIAKKERIKLYKIGRVELGRHVMLQTRDKTVRIQNRGWLHFQ